MGLLNDFTKSVTIGFKNPGEVILQIGENTGWLGQSMYFREVCGREEGAPPPVDLAAEKRNGEFVRGLIERGLVTASHDLSDGGLLVAIAEMAMAKGIGAKLDAPQGGAPHAYWFGEDQARYVVTTTSAADIEARAKAAGVPVARIGTTGGDALAIAGERAVEAVVPEAGGDRIHRTVLVAVGDAALILI